ncbi:MAG: DUF2849 domain-containing protein [Marinosulfonomonas sp.]|nr:DUF2849 domain-containing protein [Marinosulfonomonas sp.]
MTNSATPKVIAAKDVTDGDTVYLTSCDAWTRDVAVAELLGADDVGWRLAFANRLHEVTDATPIAAVEGASGLAELVAA